MVQESYCMLTACRRKASGTSGLSLVLCSEHIKAKHTYWNHKPCFCCQAVDHALCDCIIFRRQHDKRLPILVEDILRPSPLLIRRCVEMFETSVVLCQCTRHISPVATTDINVAALYHVWYWLPPANVCDIVRVHIASKSDPVQKFEGIATAASELSPRWRVFNFSLHPNVQKLTYTHKFSLVHSNTEGSLEQHLAECSEEDIYPHRVWRGIPSYIIPARFSIPTAEASYLPPVKSEAADENILTDSDVVAADAWLTKTEFTLAGTALASMQVDESFVADATLATAARFRVCSCAQTPVILNMQMIKSKHRGKSSKKNIGEACIFCATPEKTINAQLFIFGAIELAARDRIGVQYTWFFRVLTHADRSRSAAVHAGLHHLWNWGRHYFKLDSRDILVEKGLFGLGKTQEYDNFGTIATLVQEVAECLNKVTDSDKVTGSDKHRKMCLEWSTILTLIQGEKGMLRAKGTTNGKSRGGSRSGVNLHVSSIPPVPAREEVAYADLVVQHLLLHEVELVAALFTAVHCNNVSGGQDAYTFTVPHMRLDLKTANLKGKGKIIQNKNWFTSTSYQTNRSARMCAQIFQQGDFDVMWTACQPQKKSLPTGQDAPPPCLHNSSAGVIAAGQNTAQEMYESSMARFTRGLFLGCQALQSILGYDLARKIERKNAPIILYFTVNKLEPHVSDNDLKIACETHRCSLVCVPCDVHECDYIENKKNRSDFIQDFTAFDPFHTFSLVESYGCPELPALVVLDVSGLKATPAYGMRIISTDAMRAFRNKTSILSPAVPRHAFEQRNLARNEPRWIDVLTSTYIADGKICHTAAP